MSGLGTHVAPTIYGVLRFSSSYSRACYSAHLYLPLCLSRPRGAFHPLRTSHPRVSLSVSSLSSVRLPKSRQHLASSILGEIQADILSRTITVTFDHRMTGEWLTLRHQSMNFSLSAWYNLQSARRRDSLADRVHGSVYHRDIPCCVYIDILIIAAIAFVIKQLFFIVTLAM